MRSNRIYRLMITALILCGCLLNACSGGGGDNGNGTVTGTGTQSITVSGRVSANIVYPGTVKIYGVNGDGTLKTSALVTGQTGLDGSYSVTLDGYQGAIVGIAFGRYTDEATKVVVDIPEDKCLYAALADADVRGKSAVMLHISPLSDLAYRLARTTSISNIFLNNIAASNLAISQLFSVDFAATSPVSFTAVTLADGTNTSDQVRLATLLAALSQFTVNGSATPLVTPTAGDMQAALSRLATGITVTGGIVQISPEIAYLLQQAGLDLLSNVHTNTVVTAGGIAAQSMLSTLAGLGSSSGTKMARFRLRTTTTSYIGNLFGITVTVGIPAGFVLSKDSSGLTQPGVVVASGQAGINSYTSGNVVGSIVTIDMANANGFGIGEFVTVYGEIPAASTPPLVGEFSPITVIKISDPGGNDIKSEFGVEVF